MAPKDDKTETPGTKPAAVEAPPTQPVAAAPAGAKPPEAETKTPAEWAAQLGHTKPRDPRLPQSTDHVDPSYAVAEQLYGWKDHAYNFQAAGEAFLITEQTYRAAIKAAPQHPAVALVADALAPAAAERLKDFKPARNLKVERAEERAKAAAEAKDKS
jgi:hypothetical protein